MVVRQVPYIKKNLVPILRLQSGTLSTNHKGMKFKKSQLDYVIGANVTRLLEERGLKKKPFAESIDMNPGQFRSLLNGKRRWNTSYIDLIAEALQIDPIRIIYPDERKEPQAPTLTIMQSPRLKTFATGHSLAAEHFVPVRLVRENAAARAPSEITEWDIDGWVLTYADKEWLPHDPEDYTCTRVKGMSMWPILAPGDVVAIDHADRDPVSLHDQMVAFRENGGVSVKWLRHVPREQLVVGEPQNPAEKDKTLYLKGTDKETRIVGRVAWWWAKRPPRHI